MEPTREQLEKMNSLLKDDYSMSVELSISYGAVVLIKGTDRWIFSQLGKIYHNISESAFELINSPKN